MLLKAGMSTKQAVFYNLLSSVLCLLGMIGGILLGSTPEATSWIFAVAAGIFIYIALVDMVGISTRDLNNLRNVNGNMLIICFSLGTRIVVKSFRGKWFTIAMHLANFRFIDRPWNYVTYRRLRA